MSLSEYEEIYKEWIDLVREFSKQTKLFLEYKITKEQYKKQKKKIETFRNKVDKAHEMWFNKNRSS